MNQFLASTEEDDKQISKIVFKDNVSTVDQKTRMDQEFKSEGQGHKISILKKNQENQGFLADLNRYWKVLQKGTKKINNIIKENYVYSIDSETKMDQYFKSEGQCQGHKISILEIVKKHGFSVNLYQFWVKYCRR